MLRGCWFKKIIAFASAVYLHEDELRADFQQYYSLNIDDVDKAFGVAHAASLMAQLPPDSRLPHIYNPDASWSQDTYFLASIEYSLRVLVWAKTKDGQRGTNKPKPYPLPSEKAKKKSQIENSNKDYVKEILGGE